MRYLVLAAVAAISLLSLPQAEAGCGCGNFGAQGFHGQNFGGARVSSVTVTRRGGRVVQKTVVRR